MLDKLRKSKLNKPYALPYPDGWSLWEKNTKDQHPYWYFVLETVPEFFDDIWYSIMYYPRKLKSIYRCRFKHKYYLVDTGLDKNQYHEIEERLLHANFSLLKQFVEKEKAWMQTVFANNKDENKGLSEREKGLKYLDWEISLTYNSDYCVEETDSQFGKPTPQALAAKTVKELYLWYVDERPKRIDPYELSGWSDYCSLNKELKDTLKDTTESKKILKKLDKIEKQYRDEDTKMLKKLIDVRESLWT